MFVHETHSFYIIAKLGSDKSAPIDYLEKKNTLFNKALTNIGVSSTVDFDGIWTLKDVMYASADDIYDIIFNELVRLVAQDDTIANSEKKLYELSVDYDKIIVSEYLTDNTYTMK